MTTIGLTLIYHSMIIVHLITIVFATLNMKKKRRKKNR